MPPPSDPTPRLVLRGIRKSFGSRAVLDHVDLDVEAGSIVLLTGGNGSGKTTLLRCVAGLADFEGAVTLDGRTLGKRGAGHVDIGYLPQTPGMPTWATVAEVLALFARLRGADADALDLPSGFLPPLDQPVGQLSGGQRQRVAFTVALLGGPSLLLLDEPAANLDDDGRAAMTEILGGLRDTGTSVLVAAPSPGDLNGLPDRAVRIVDGRLAGDATLHLVRPGAGSSTTGSLAVPGPRTDQEVPA